MALFIDGEEYVYQVNRYYGDGCFVGMVVFMEGFGISYHFHPLAPK